MAPEKLNLEGISDKMIFDTKRSLVVLNTFGEVSLIAHEAETEQLLAEIAEAGINLFDTYTSIQNILRVKGLYFIQLKRRMFSRNTKGEVTALEAYDLYLVAYKKLGVDYGKLSIAPPFVRSCFYDKVVKPHIFIRRAYCSRS